MDKIVEIDGPLLLVAFEDVAHVCCLTGTDFQLYEARDILSEEQ